MQEREQPGKTVMPPPPLCACRSSFVLQCFLSRSAEGRGPPAPDGCAQNRLKQAVVYGQLLLRSPLLHANARLSSIAVVKRTVHASEAGSSLRCRIDRLYNCCASACLSRERATDRRHVGACVYACTAHARLLQCVVACACWQCVCLPHALV